MAEKKKLYRVTFFNQGKFYELYARAVGQAELFGFIEISELVFGEKSAVLVDPTEDSLKQEFENTQSILVPLHSIVRIDTMNKSSHFRPRVINMKENIPTAPVSSVYTPPNPFGGR